MAYQYTYLLMGVLFLVIWLILFVWRKDTRKEMLTLSLIFGFLGILGDFFYTQDWWHPLTLTKTTIGFEAFFVGFVIGGIASVIYEEVFKKKIKLRKAGKIRKAKRNLNFVFIISLALLLLFAAFYLLKLNSFFSTIIAFAIPTIIIWAKRKDLIADSVFSGFLFVIIAFLVYNALEFLTPGWVQAFWYFKNIPEIIILNVSLDDIVWYFLAGLFIGPLYEYWQEGRLVKLK